MSFLISDIYFNLKRFAAYSVLTPHPCVLSSFWSVYFMSHTQLKKLQRKNTL